jgi:small GTP-binding protein
MASDEKYSNHLPPGTKEAAQMIWDSLSPADRQAVLDLIDAFPSKASLIQLLIKLASGQIKAAFGSKHRVAIVGPTNVGKSTLYNQLVQRKEDQAKVSPLPGTTRENQQADAGLFTIVDTPGADATGEKGQKEQDLALSAAADADFILIMFDAIQGIKKTELDLFERLIVLGKPYLVVLNKIDLVKRESKQVVAGVAEMLHLENPQVIPIAARTGENLDDVLVSIAILEPGIVAALGQALPQYRWQLSWRAIVSAASASAAIALTPLPVIDFLPLIAVQSIMVLSIARIYNYQLTLERARELVMTFGLGFLGRMLFQELSKLGGIPGWLLSAAIAASTTTAMGYAASVWFDTGERVSNDTLKRITRSLTDQMLARLRALGKHRPSKQSMEETIQEALSGINASESRANLDPTPPPDQALESKTQNDPQP